MNSFIQFIKSLKSILKVVPGALKGGDDAIFNDSEHQSANISIQKEVSDHRVGEHLLKGELTEEVQELRYRTYEVADKSKDYKYLGDGIAVKKDNEKHTEEHYSFYQENKKECQTVLQGMQDILDNTKKKDLFTLNISYNSIVRNRIERHVKSFKVKVDGANCYITLYVDTNPDPNDSTSKPFLNELKKVAEGNKKSEIVDSVNAMAFVTSNANGESDMISYTLSLIELSSINKTNENYEITYISHSYRIDNLKDKFYYEKMAEKYKQNLPKDNRFTMEDLEERQKCEKCGKDITRSEALATKKETGQTLCLNCYKNYLLSTIKF